MASELAAYLAHCQRQVDAQLARYLPEHNHSPLHQAMRYSLFNGGKRIRPALCYSAAELFDAVTPATHRAAAALEMIHAYSLIHDDLPAMDDDDLRRGKPTCHIAFGEATAILAGDGLQALAFEVLADPEQPEAGDAQLALRMLRELASAAGPAGMVGGQALDLGAVNRVLDLPALEAMHNAKTGALITASVQLGALSSGAATASELEALRRFSAAIGVAFQVKDDILDVESHTDTLGKRQGADRALNKPTYTSLLGLDGAKAKLAQLHHAAHESLAPFGTRSTRLAALADFIVSRDH